MLRKKTIDLPFTTSADKKTDDKTLNGKPDRVENVVYRKNNRLDKRKGYTALPSTGLSGTIEGMSKLGSQLLAWAGKKLFSYSGRTSEWQEKGKLYCAGVSSYQLTSGIADVNEVAAASLGDLSLVAYRGGVPDTDPDIFRLMLIETTTGRIVDKAVYTGLGKNLRLFSVGSEFWLVYTYSPSIELVKLDGEGAFISSSSLVTDASDQLNSMAFLDSDFILVYRTSSTNMKFVSFDISSGSENSTHVLIDTPVNFLEIVRIDTDQAVVAYGRSSDTVALYTIDSSLTISSVISSYHQTSASNYETTNFAAWGKDATGFMVAYGLKSTVAERFNITSTQKIRFDSGSYEGEQVRRTLTLISRPVTIGGRVYFLGAHQSPLQSTYFLVDEDLEVVAKAQPGAAGVITRLVDGTVSGGVAYFPGLNRSILVSSDKENKLQPIDASFKYSPDNLCWLSFDLDDQEVFNAVELHDTLFIAGGSLAMYDGLNLTEQGFHLYPEILTVTAPSAAVDEGERLYVAFYEWYDAHGNVYRSAPSLPTVADALTSGAVTLEIPTLHLTNKEKVGIVLARTLPNQSNVFYRINASNESLENDTAVDVIEYEDTLSDEDLISHEVLYTVGGVLDNVSAPACRYVTSYQRRLVLGGMEKDQITFSKVVSPYIGVEFAAEHVTQLSGQYGRCTGVLGLDDKLVIAQEEGPAYLYGEGPNDLGVGAFAGPLPISVDLPSIKHKSMVPLKSGIICRTDAGFFFWTLGTEPAYIGAGVEDLQSLDITSSVKCTTEKEIRFLHSDGSALVFNYDDDFLRWSVFTGLESSGGAYLRGQFYRADTTTVFEEDGWSDNGVGYQPLVRFGWLEMAGLTGYQRLYKMGLTGHCHDASSLRVSAEHDFIEGSAQSQDIDLSEGPITLQIHNEKQKCNAVRYTVEGLSGAEAFSLNALSLTIGKKEGRAKLPSSKVFGLGG